MKKTLDELLKYLSNEDTKFENNINEERDRVFSLLKNKEIPENYSLSFVKNYYDTAFSSLMLREEIIKLQGFPLLTKDWIEPLAKWIGDRKCLEIMAGLGSLTHCLKKQGVDIIATDNNSFKKMNFVSNRWCEVEDINSEEAIRKYGKDVDIIIMSWPEMNNTAFKALEKMKKINPNCMMIYIGEGCGGCTANDHFFHSMEIVEDEEFYQSVFKFQNWECIHDGILLVK